MFIVEAYITRAARPKYLEGQCSQELILAIFTAGFPFFSVYEYSKGASDGP